MSAVPADLAAGVPAAEDVDAVCDRFETAWRAVLAGGQGPRIEDFRDAVSPADGARLLRELVLLDILYRTRTGEEARPEDYRGRFPNLDEPWLAAWVLMQERTWARGQPPARPPDPSASLTGADCRRCPTCRNPLPPTDGREEVLCPGCGSTFRVRAGPGTPGAVPCRMLGKFELVERVGAGACGEVWKARDTELHRVVALKLPHAGPLAEPGRLERFRREARAAAQLRHPGIVTVHEVATLDGLPALVADFVHGLSLKELLQARPLTFREAAALLAEVAEAVHHAHRAGVVHRDLKPTNVMVARSPDEPGVGRPLVTDFGLALWQGAGPTLTADGDVVGTPAYMSPEQAGGQAHAADARSDVFSLGVILYELLTGELPFRGSAAMLLLQVRREEPRSPRRLNDRVPRDLETICLRCLEKEPRRRYPSALALAEDLRRYLAGEPIRARPVGRLERGWKWAKRNPAAAGLLAAVVAAVAAAGAGVWWLTRERAERREAVEAALAEVGRLEEHTRWGEARAVLEQAERRLGDGGPADLRDRLAHARAALDLVARLDEIHLKRQTWVRGRFDVAGAAREYEEAFRAAGMEEVGSDQAAAAAWVGRTGVRAAVVEALDDWALSEARPQVRTWALGVARRVDPEPWRDRVRDPEVWTEPGVLRRLTMGEQVAGQPPRLLVLIGALQREQGADPIPVLRATQECYPGDFWGNFELANALMEKRPAEAVGFYRAAVAVRPDTFAVHNNLGNALYLSGQSEEAAGHYRRAIEIDPRDPWAHDNLGNVLRDRGWLDEALAEYRTAVALDPSFPKSHYNLALALDATGKPDEAIAELRRAVALEPHYPQAHYGLGNVLRARGRPGEAEAEYRKAIAQDARFAQAHNNLGNALDEQGKREEAFAEFQLAIDIDPRLAPAHNNVGNVLSARGKLDEAAAAFRRAIDSDPRFGKPHFNLAFVLRRQGKVDEAATEYRKAIELDPRDAQAHNNLGSILYDHGRREEGVAEYCRALDIDPNLAPAHLNLAIALRSTGRVEEAAAEYRKVIELDPRDAQAHLNLGEALGILGKRPEAVAEFRRAVTLEPTNYLAHGALGQVLLQEGQFSEACQASRRCLELLPGDHPLRPFVSEQLRRCEQMVGLNQKLAAILDKKEKPADAAEQVNLAGLCALRRRPAAAVRFFEAAFAERPALADDLQAGHRRAAVRAVLAAAGESQDAGERARLRRLALGWLRADLGLWDKQAAVGKPEQRAAVQQVLGEWQRDPDLAALRDPAALAKLPADERAGWEKLWAEVEALRKKVGEDGGK